MSEIRITCVHDDTTGFDVTITSDMKRIILKCRTCGYPIYYLLKEGAE